MIYLQLLFYAFVVIYGFYAAINIATNKEPFNTSDSIFNRIAAVVVILIVVLNSTLDFLIGVMKL
ncbi:hypothetical protein AVV30_gp035 [Vibrio phage phi 1]|uniref:Uncharacterized protein n=1 Tax=Vibrio phage phi 1 TaxID=1589297 RepID=A0A0B5H8J1_9CAUD|nr:hypothetical protein AVV30_gp035 [Vibrio phage phi 1]AJF40693.1 hypothetical protein SBVP1_0035 [Vibrio phage phi 1]